jgi:hypothetical protein
MLQMLTHLQLVFGRSTLKLVACCFASAQTVCLFSCMPAGTVRSSNKTSQQVILQFPQAVPTQPLVPVLRLQFSYKLQEGLDGFYRSSYIGESPRPHQTAIATY